MRVLLSSTMYPQSTSGWQGVFIGHMAQALARQSDIDLMICAPPGEAPPSARFTTTDAEALWLANLVEQGGISHVLRRRNLSAITTSLRLLKLLSRNYRSTDVDLYHVNWLQTALPLPDNGVPALITVLGNDLKLLRLPLMKALMRRKLAGRRTALCPNADWMTAPLEQLFGDVTDVRPVPFGIDPRWYEVERVALTPGEPQIWLTVARLTKAKIGPLFEWSEPYFNGSGRQLHVFGPMEEQICVPEWARYHGPASPTQLAQQWFPRATGLITLSHHAEGRPQVMLEAMASGLPIIASKMPAHADLVNPGVTGFMCSTPREYERAILDLEEPTTNRTLGEAARRRVRQEVGTWDDCAQRYASIYGELLGATA